MDNILKNQIINKFKTIINSDPRLGTQVMHRRYESVVSNADGTVTRPNPVDTAMTALIGNTTRDASGFAGSQPNVRSIKVVRPDITGNLRLSDEFIIASDTWRVLRTLATPSESIWSADIIKKS